MYRLAYGIDDHGLRGQPVVFIGYVDRSFDIRRAEVALLETDGSQGTKYLVNPHYVIDFWRDGAAWPGR